MLGIAIDLRPFPSAKLKIFNVALSSVPIHSSCEAAFQFGE